MGILKQLEPKGVFHYFEELCEIPHGSGNTKEISDYCVAFAKEHNLQYMQDEWNNIIITKEATNGYENSEPIILQGHLDMVCEKTNACMKDMSKEGLDLYIEGDFVSAKDTTLGGDDGIAVAMALAILADDSIPHPKLEVIFTVDEEVGMIGASKLDTSSITARKMINMDSEDEGIFTVSCAGGNLTTCQLPIKRETVNGETYKIIIAGLTGGHSGAEIDKGRANSNILLGRILYRINSVSPIRIISVQGGLKDNAIANKSTSSFVTNDYVRIEPVLQRIFADIKKEYLTTDPNMDISIVKDVQDMPPMDAESTDKTIAMLTCLPNGIQAMSVDILGLVQTSLNLGILKTDSDGVEASFCVRSSVESQKQMLVDRLDCLMDQLGGSVAVAGDYPGWEYNKNSTLRQLMMDVFKEQYGYEPKVEAIHAGVECGLFAGKLEGLDCVSIGPDLKEIHTYREKMSISSVQRVWEFVLEVLKRS